MFTYIEENICFIQTKNGNGHTELANTLHWTKKTVFNLNVV